MKRFFVGLTLATCLVSPAFAKTPPEVLKPYKQYRAAFEAGDAALAAQYAYEAWQKAEELMGDSKTTGDLAQNFADIKSKKYRKAQYEAYDRSMELVAGYGDQAGDIFIQRGVAKATLYAFDEKFSDSYKAAKNVVKYADENALTETTLYGEAMTLMSQYHARKGNHRQTKKYAKGALAAFEAASDDIVSAYPILANLYAGYGMEAEDETVEAALSYQKVMEAIDGVAPEDHPIAARALGRWSHMRSRLKDEGKLAEAEQQGLCKCWPYDKDRNESLKPVKREAPKMPRKAYTSGYSIVQFDLDDAGKPTNTQILVSWPKDIYDSSSLKAIEKWQYTPRTADETDSDREDLIVTLRYMLTDNNGDMIF
ncbi:TonB family protein [Litorimonas sp. RW-G-Af-16]|uniref:TonB family protein n=1 Tax=Litorimonas sp. RW-G-Af-16 TaxID=3241168 RepID=UPI00390C8BC0